MNSWITANNFDIFKNYIFNGIDIQMIRTNNGEIFFKTKYCTLSLEYKDTVDAFRIVSDKFIKQYGDVDKNLNSKYSHK